MALSLIQDGSLSVASRVEAWIEINSSRPHLLQALTVASRVEAWIEITYAIPKAETDHVASRVEAWIEITMPPIKLKQPRRRLPRGGVD